MTGSTPPARARAESKSATYAAGSAAKKEETGAAPINPSRAPSVVTEPTQVPGSCGSGIATKQRTDRDNFFETLASALGAGFGSAIPASFGVRINNFIALSSGVGAGASVLAHHLLNGSPSHVTLEGAAVSAVGAYTGNRIANLVYDRMIPAADASDDADADGARAEARAAGAEAKAAGAEARAAGAEARAAGARADAEARAEATGAKGEKIQPVGGKASPSYIWVTAAGAAAGAATFTGVKNLFRSLDLNGGGP